MTQNIKESQKKLELNIINYDIDKMWNSHKYIDELRSRVARLMPKAEKHDPQDLEHQVLFRLTTYDPRVITDKQIQETIDEQLLIVQDRLSKLDFDIEYLFRGLTGKYQDLNVKDRLTLCWEDEKLIAKNDKRSFNVDFRVIHDEKIISLFSSDLHYIHQDRPRGETFGFFFVGDEIPWAIETTEPSVIAKQYKRDALLANGIDPNKAVELTRFYTLPGAPTNAISLMDGLVSKYYKAKGIEALFTTTMPMYSKTKSTTIAGGINKPLLVKDLRHKFMPVTINGKKCYKHLTTIPETHTEIEIIKSHQNFPTMLVVEVFRTINEPSLQPLPVLRDGGKVVYVKQRENSYLEEEIKLPVEDISKTLEKIRNVAKHATTYYIRDVIYGGGKDEKKLRLRIEDDFAFKTINATRKYKVAIQDDVKKEIEETVYNGERYEDALTSIQAHGDFKEENSYEKMRVKFLTSEGVEITLDVYPFGNWLEIEGPTEAIHKTAKDLGYSRKDYLNDSADDIYLRWIKENNLKEQWDVRFGLAGKK